MDGRTLLSTNIAQMPSQTSTVADYRPVGSPASVRPLPARTALSADIIDYHTHPAYAAYARASFAERLSASAHFASQFALLALKRLVRYEMMPRSLREPRGWRDRIGFLKLAGRNALFRATDSYGAGKADPLLGTIVDDGVAVVAMPKPRLAELLKLAEPQFADLERRRGLSNGGREFDESRAAADPRDEAALYTLLDTIFAESGVLEAASRYAGRRLRLIDVNPQINDVSDSFWQDIFPDREGAAHPRTAYFHRDASGGDLKAIVYCTDVGNDNGPFTYAVGSNRLAISRVDDLLREANDHNGLSATDPDSRRRFAALPRRWRQKGSFGNDLGDETELSQAIVASAWDVEGPAGSIVLFDTKGIHRGGMVRSGERRVITCVLG